MKYVQYAKKSLAAVAAASLFAVTASATDIVVIVNERSPVEQISEEDAKALLTGKKDHWSDLPELQNNIEETALHKKNRVLVVETKQLKDSSWNLRKKAGFITYKMNDKNVVSFTSKKIESIGFVTKEFLYDAGGNIKHKNIKVVYGGD